MESTIVKKPDSDESGFLHFLIIPYHTQSSYVNVLIQQLALSIITTRKSVTINKFLTEGEFWEVDETLFAGVRRHVPEGLDGEVALNIGGIECLLHLPHPVQTHERVEVTVDSHNIRSW